MGSIRWNESGFFYFVYWVENVPSELHLADDFFCYEMIVKFLYISLATIGLNDWPDATITHALVGAWQVKTQIKLNVHKRLLAFFAIGFAIR